MLDYPNAVRCGRQLRGYTCDSVLYLIVPDKNGTFLLHCAKCGCPKSARTLNKLKKGVIESAKSINTK